MAPTPVWQARTGGAPDPAFLAYSQSVVEDAALVAYDVVASIAHVAGLVAAELVADKEGVALVEGLQAVARAHAAGTFTLDPALEDVHMNVEAKLTQELGDVGRKLHTGRSRNDQVATDFTLFARARLAAIASGAHDLSAALAEAAALHAATPWVARTHGQPAQAATLGFLLAAHALRFHDLACRTLQVFDRAGESALGSGAVAGSTLPLRPDVAARALGLMPPRNGLLATGSRDVLVETCQLASSVGIAAASLAEDLLQLGAGGFARTPDPFTTGSSLMPQKRNPDALELARAKGRALAGPLAAVTAVVSGLPLGYHRDLQVVKPHVIAATTDAVATLDILQRVVGATTFDAKALARSLELPGISATDVAEALVGAGIPFRTAYTAVAGATAAVENGEAFDDALFAQGLPEEAVRVAMRVRTPDPARRTTQGGSAPARVRETLDALGKEAAATGEAIEAALDAANAPLLLLAADPFTLITTTTKEP